jgi:hypothetical protein
MRGSWLAVACVVLVGSAGLVAACGSSGDGAVFTEDSGIPDGTSINPNPGDDSGQVFINDASGDGGPVGTCVPRTCAQLGANCGPQGDGCGNIIQCGSCTSPATCGGGGTPSVCGGAAGCVPKTCAQLNANCGAQGDGCGGIIASCGTCTSPAICGGGGVANQCGATIGGGDGGTCVPTKNACAPGDCGFISDGCGNVINCPACVAPQLCGATTPNVCGGGTLPDGGPICTPKTCAQLGVNCGQVADGCGGLTPNCGSCTAPDICGGGGTPSVCGGGNAIDAGPCTGLCGQQVGCDGGATTTITGTVYAPNGVEPLPNVIVYVPNGGPPPTYGVQPFTQGVACNQCGADVTGSPLVKTITGPNGTFSLGNMPVGANIPLVIQIGRWRRQVVIPAVPACTSTAVAATLTHLPRTKAEGDIPLTAIATGSVDTMECVLRKIGVADSEFTAPNGTGRIHLWQGDDGFAGFGEAPPLPGQPTPWGGVPQGNANGLYTNQATLNKYDQMIIACNGDPSKASLTDPDRTRFLNYVNTGGRIFATHYEYVLLNAFAPFSQTADWNVDQATSTGAVTGDVDNTFTKGLVFAQWLQVVGALAAGTPTVNPRITLNVSRHDIDPLPAPPGTGVVAPGQRWVSVDPNSANLQGANYKNAPQHYTFNTPWGTPPAQQCGRVLFSDFHVSNASVNGARFPTQCSNTGLTPQEKVIEYMLFDLGNCIAPDVPPPPPVCIPKTCAQQGITCGPAGDGCGGLIAGGCGTCVGNQTCGGGGVPGQCGGPSCTPKTCAQQGFNCGLAGDGCGGQLNCGTCATNQTCGGGGSNICGTPSCTPKTCQALGVACGPAGDGCGNIIQCGPCTAPDTCGGGGTPGQCGHPACTPTTCAAQNATCGPLSDGCGGILDCGTCAPPATCGGGGVANQCGGGIK